MVIFHSYVSLPEGNFWKPEELRLSEVSPKHPWFTLICILHFQNPRLSLPWKRCSGGDCVICLSNPREALEPICEWLIPPTYGVLGDGWFIIILPTLYKNCFDMF